MAPDDEPLLELWHSTSDAARAPQRVRCGEAVVIHAGTHPIAEGQAVWLRWRVGTPREESERVELRWQRNEGSHSYWAATIGPFRQGGRGELHGEAR